LQGNSKKPGNELSKYTAMSFKMGAVITAGFLGGNYLDKYLGWKYPISTLVLGMIGLVLSIYIIIVDTRKK
jgi:hypothetical protein